MPNVFKYPFIAVTFAFGLLSFAIYAEYFSAGVQVFKDASGQPLGHLFHSVMLYSEAVGLSALALVLAAIAARQFNVVLGWVVVAVFLIATAAIYSIMIGHTSILHLFDEYSWAFRIGPWVWTSLVVISVLAIILELLPPAAIELKLALIGALCFAIIGAIFPVYFLTGSAVHFAYADTLVEEGGRIILIGAMIWVGFAITIKRYGVWFWVISAGFVLTLVWVYLTSQFLGRMGMPRRYIDFPDAFEFWATRYAIARYALAAVVILAGAPMLTSSFKHKQS